LVRFLLDDLEGYVGKAADFLRKAKIPIWSRILMVFNDGTKLEGMLLPAPRDTDEYIYVKLNNGYNIAFSVNKIREIVFIAKEEVKYKIPERELLHKPTLPNILLIGAGGTIASRVEYTTGAVKPAFSPTELANSIPEIFSIANITTITLFNIFSEDMQPKYWIEMAKRVAKELRSGYTGVVITHGTDTMQFSAAALSFMLNNLPVPVVFTGAQRSSDRPASDAASNVINSVLFAAHGEVAEVLVCMHANLDDTSALVHRGVRVRKMHSSRRDAFRTIGDHPVAYIRDGKIRYLKKDYQRRGLYSHSDVYADATFEEKVALLYVFPGINPEIIDFLIDKKYRGIIIAGTGLGHVPETLLRPIQRGVEEGILFFMATQCLWGPVNLNVYERGRVLRKLGVIPADGMLPEVAYVKLGWLLGHDYTKEQVITLMQTNLRYEIVKKEPLNAFFSNL